MNRKPAEERFKGLIIAGNIVAGLLLFCILVTAVVTIRKSRMHDAYNSVSQIAVDQEIYGYDTSTVIDDYFPTAENSMADAQETQNDVEYTQIRIYLQDSAIYTKVDPALTELSSLSDETCLYVRQMHAAFVDTMAFVTSTNEPEFCKAFFVNTGRADELYKKLKTYRDRAKIYARQIGVNIDENDYLPLDSPNTTTSREPWDESQMTSYCSIAINYLQSLELQVRALEDAILSQKVNELYY
jgi:hypothetical protein